MKANILSRKDHIDIMEDNKYMEMLKDEMWTRRQIIAEVKVIKRNHYIGRNTTEWNKRTGSTQGTRKERWISIGREWIGLCRWENLCAKQPKDQRKNTSRKP